MAALLLLVGFVRARELRVPAILSFLTFLGFLTSKMGRCAPLPALRIEASLILPAKLIIIGKKPAKKEIAEILWNILVNRVLHGVPG
jgi:hypothetical protein